VRGAYDFLARAPELADALVRAVAFVNYRNLEAGAAAAAAGVEARRLRPSFEARDDVVASRTSG
jgi:hypothetical protein